ncbi:MAG: hypothetical protein HOV92_37250 [Streptomyces sp.]|nr:hypothetical protein [Streptomyces sp.]
MRGLLDGENAIEAADALWTLTGDAAAVLAVLLTPDGDVVAHRGATEVLARLGPEAAPAVHGLRRETEAPHVWMRTPAACALWRIGGEAESELVLPLLRSTWARTPELRRPIAECVAAMGPAGAPLHDLLRAELAAPQRYMAPCGGYAPLAVLSDERLLEICRSTLGVG